jgi:hypothetical protein
MTWLKTFLSRFQALFLREKLEGELEAEVRGHLEMETEENIRRGMSPEEARYAALRTFGGVDQAKEAWRDRRWLSRETSCLPARWSSRTLLRSDSACSLR